MAYTNLLYHLVFGTKERLPFITDELKSHFHAYLGGTVRGLGGVAFEINGMNDHVHLLVKLNTTHRLDYFLRDLKANSSKWAKEKTNGQFSWQRRYGAFTVSESQFAVVQNYIRNQEAHHKKFDFKQEFETMLRANGLEIDEYLWKD